MSLLVGTAHAPEQTTDVGDSIEWRGAQSDWRARYPARPVPTEWAMTCADREELDRILADATTRLPSQVVRKARCRGLPLLLDWLADQPGDTWQHRWLASGADAAGQTWARRPEQWLRRRCKYSDSRFRWMTGSLPVLIGTDVVRPSPVWLLTGGRNRKLVRNMLGRDPRGLRAIAPIV